MAPSATHSNGSPIAEQALPAEDAPRVYKLGPRGRRTNIDQIVGLHHVALFRAYLEGVALEEVGDRYLGGPHGRHITNTQALHELKWVRKEFIRAARRAGQVEYVDLLAREPKPLRGSNLKTLEEFADELGDFYTERELAAKWQEEFGAAVQEEESFVERQIRAINDLAPLIVCEPAPNDPVASWFSRKASRGLEAGGVLTIQDLVGVIRRRGVRWYAEFHRIGPTVAEKINNWVLHHSASLGLTPEEAPVLAPRNAVVGISPVRKPGFGIAPIELLSVPEQFAGENGANRAPALSCRIDAANDLAAIQAWLSMRRNGSHTWRQYRTQAERFLLWAIFHRQKPLSSVTAEDCAAYRDWLRAPEPTHHWIGPAATPRGAPEWRPFNGPLSERSIEVACTTLAALFNWLCSQGYLAFNPWKGVPKSDALKGATIDSTRSFTTAEWQRIAGYAKSLPETPASLRVRVLLALGYATGLRLTEVANLTLGNLKDRPLAGDGHVDRCWVAKVTGKGNRVRDIPLPDGWIDLLSKYLEADGLPGAPARWDATTPVIRTTAAGARDRNRKMTSSGIYRCIKEFFRECANEAFAGEPAAQDQLLRASTHWLRHTFGTHAAALVDDIKVVQEILGHASLSTTQVYTGAGLKRKRSAIETMFAQM